MVIVDILDVVVSIGFAFVIVIVCGYIIALIVIVRQYSGSLAHPRGMYYNGKEFNMSTLL